jgi:hypothetical protein
MKRTLIASAILLGATALSAGAFAQSTSGSTPVVSHSTPVTTGTAPVTTGTRPVTGSGAPTPAQTTLGRDVRQQDRIETGLQNGQLTTREGAQLERDEARINAVQSRDMRNGSLSAGEQAQLDRMQDRVSQDIHADRTNGVRGNPNSASSQRLQADVQRNANQQTRIDNGVTQGSLTTHEASRLEGGQARNDAREYAAGRNGYVSQREQRGIQQQDNRRSAGIWSQKHDAQHRRY